MSLKSRAFAQRFPTIIVWAVSLFSSSVRYHAGFEGKWGAGWIQFFMMGIPMLSTLI
jgi:hypothetical protein